MVDRVRFDEGRRLVIPPEEMGRLAKVETDQLRLIRLADDLLVCGQAQPGERPAALLYGDLRLFHVAELMALISAMRRSGGLTLMVPHARKTITFTDGEVVFASSTVEDDRLGEVLWRRGFLTLDQLGEVHDMVRPGMKLGRVLIDRGLLTPRKLYDGLREQVLEILYSTFHFDRGEFFFVEGAPRRKGTLGLEVSTREIIAEGVRRVQEMTRLEELFPDREAVLGCRPVQVDVKLDEHERHLRSLVDAKRTVAQLIEASHLGEFEALKGLARLVSIGLVDARVRTEVQRQEAGDLPKVLAGYAKLLRRIHQTLKLEAPDAMERLEAYLAIPARRYRDTFKGVAMGSEGKLDVDTLLRNAKRLDPARAREVALGALRAFYDYAVFQAMDVLPDSESDALLKRLDQERVKLENTKAEV